MKRHQQLQPLSRQHHNGLLAALLLKKGLRKSADPAIMAAFVSHFWDTDLKAHFESEEQVLIPALDKAGIDAVLTRQLLEEHAELRAIIASIQTGSVHAVLFDQFASLLEAHIRFEEKVYFPEAERVLNEQQLLAVGIHLHENKGANCMNYPVKFWE